MLIHRYADGAGAAAALAEAVAGQLRAGIAGRGVASAVLSGGRSPVAFLKALSVLPLDWTRVWVTLADERWVDATGPDSNEALLRANLLTGAARAARFIGLKNAAPDPASGCAAAHAALAALPVPVDAVVLGMGLDGHTASLFPGMPGLDRALDPNGTALLTPATAPTVPHARLSFTLAGLLRARHIHLPLQGLAKQAVFEQARAGVDARHFPIAAVLGQARVPVTVYLSDD